MKADKQRRENPILHPLFRYPSYYVAWLFIKLGISANVTTVLALSVGLVGLWYLAAGSYLYSVLGAVLLVFALELDYVDGNIARFRGTESEFGHKLEAYAFVVLFKVLTPIVVAAAIANSDSAVSLPLFSGFAWSSSYVFFSLGLLVVLLTFLPSFAGRLRKSDSYMTTPSLPLNVGLGMLIPLLPLFVASQLLVIYLLLALIFRSLLATQAFLLSRKNRSKPLWTASFGKS